MLSKYLSWTKCIYLNYNGNPCHEQLFSKWLVKTILTIIRIFPRSIFSPLGYNRITCNPCCLNTAQRKRLAMPLIFFETSWTVILSVLPYSMNSLQNTGRYLVFSLWSFTRDQTVSPCAQSIFDGHTWAIRSHNFVCS